MPDTQPQGDAPVAPEATTATEQPAALASTDVERIVTERLTAAQAAWESKVNERVTGFQQLVSQKDAEIQKLKTASLSDDERDQLRIESQEQSKQDFETEKWLFQKAKENAAAAELLEKWLSTDDPDELFKFATELSSRQAPPAPETPVTPEPSEQVPDIDRNNPSGRQVPPGTPVTADGQVLDKEFRKNFLSNLPYWPTGGA